MSREHGTALEADIEYLHTCFAEGHQITKDQARDGYGIPERRFRAAVSALRREGVPIVSFSERGSTYRMARDAAELEHFINELASRRDDLDAQIRALRRPPTQLRMAI